MGVDLALVVGGAAGQHVAVPDDRLERRARPEVERIDRLDVVMAVDDDGRRIGSVKPVRIDDRVAVRFGHLDVVEAGGPERVGKPGRRAADVGGVLRQRRDAREPKELHEGLEARLVRRLEQRLEIARGDGRGRIGGGGLVGHEREV